MKKVEQEVSNSKVLHIDEPAITKKGKLGWCWMFTSDTASFVRLTESRGISFTK
jgi:transposase